MALVESLSKKKEILLNFQSVCEGQAVVKDVKTYAEDANLIDELKKRKSG